MLCQLRRYQVREGAMDEFVALWRDHIVPAREAHGFQVLGAWNDPSDGTFVWVVGHDAPDGWEAIDRAYYDSPERAAVPRDPAELLVKSETQLQVLEPV
jgi:hypothetical protein